MFLVSWHVLSRVLYRCTVSFLFLSSLLLGLLWRWCFFSFGIFTFKPGRELWLLWLLCLQRGSNHGSNSSSNPGSRQCWLHMQHVMHLSSVAGCEGSMAKGLMQSDPVIFCCLFMLEFWDFTCYWPALAGGPGPPTSPEFGADTGLDFSPSMKAWAYLPDLSMSVKSLQPVTKCADGRSLSSQRRASLRRPETLVRLRVYAGLSLLMRGWNLSSPDTWGPSHRTWQVHDCF